MVDSLVSIFSHLLLNLLLHLVNQLVLLLELRVHSVLHLFVHLDLVLLLDLGILVLLGNLGYHKMSLFLSLVRVHLIGMNLPLGILALLIVVLL